MNGTPQHWTINQWNRNAGLITLNIAPSMKVQFTVNEYRNLTVTHLYEMDDMPFADDVPESALEEFYELGKQWWTQFYGDNNND